MLLELESFAIESNITFSTDINPSKSKSKCIFVCESNRNLEKPAPLTLCGKILPYVRQADHLGNVLTEMGNMEQDASVKRATFIRSSSEIRETFKNAAPQEIIKALKIYCTSFYGSSLWDLNSVKARQMYSAWDYSVKLVWNCPRWTRTYFVQQLLCCGFPSARVDIQSRFVIFTRASNQVPVMRFKLWLDFLVRTFSPLLAAS